MNLMLKALKSRGRRARASVKANPPYSKLIHPITFIDTLVKFNELGKPFQLMDHQREVLRFAFAFDQDGRLPWDTIS